MVLDSGLYNKLNLEMLSDVNTYRYLSSDPTKVFSNKLKCLLQEGVAMGAITKKNSEDLFVSHPVIPVFHSLPKIHKEVFPPPLRPIVAGIGSLSERLGS